MGEDGSGTIVMGQDGFNTRRKWDKMVLGQGGRGTR